MADILIIDDEDYIRDVLSSRVTRMGHDPDVAPDLKTGLARLEARPFDLVFLDVNLPDGDGLEALPRIKQAPSAPEVVIITAVGSAHGAELAIRNGAWDYIAKPFKKEEIILLVQQTLAFREARLQQENSRVLNTEGIIGNSTEAKACIRKLARSAANTANVLIQGETGTGKEVFARAIHDNCRLTRKHFVVVDCAAMPESLTESILFGHSKGAFTGADTRSDGLIKQADQGTLFLDEIGELPLSVQKAFLRVLQEKRFRPVGSSREISSNFRLISATNRDLDKMVAEGTFREDLFHRLKTFSIKLPPLRDRQSDIKPLATFYTEKLCEKHGIVPKAIPPDTLALLKAYHWPGNVRELVNAIEKAILSEPDLPLLYPVFLPNRIRLAKTRRHFKTPPPSPSVPFDSILYLDERADTIPNLKDFRSAAVEKIETVYLRFLLKQTDYDLDRAAEISDLSKNRIYFLLRKYEIKLKT